MEEVTYVLCWSPRGPGRCRQGHSDKELEEGLCHRLKQVHLLLVPLVGALPVPLDDPHPHEEGLDSGVLWVDPHKAKYHG